MKKIRILRTETVVIVRNLNSRNTWNTETELCKYIKSLIQSDDNNGYYEVRIERVNHTESYSGMESGGEYVLRINYLLSSDIDKIMIALNDSKLQEYIDNNVGYYSDEDED